MSVSTAWKALSTRKGETLEHQKSATPALRQREWNSMLLVEPADVDISHKEGRELLVGIPRAGRSISTIQVSSNSSRDCDVVRVVFIIRGRRKSKTRGRKHG